MRVIDISYKHGEGLARTLSNLMPRPFVLDGVHCGSMEGFLQSLKLTATDQAGLRDRIAALHGFTAFKLGQEFNGWKAHQLLRWDDVVFERSSGQYQFLLDRAYDAQLIYSEELERDLLASVGYALRHTRGKHDSRDTVLTESEYVRQLERLRWRVLNERHVIHRLRAEALGGAGSDGAQLREAVSDASPSGLG